MKEKNLRYIGVGTKIRVTDSPYGALKTEYTFIRYIPVRRGSLSRMKVRHDLPARKGYYGKQGGADAKFAGIMRRPIPVEKISNTKENYGKQDQRI